MLNEDQKKELFGLYEEFPMKSKGTLMKKLRLKGQDRLKGDERILGDSDFVTSILAEAKEKLNRFLDNFRDILDYQRFTILEG